MGEDEALLAAVAAAVEATGDKLRGLFTRDARIGGVEALLTAIHAADAASLAVLRPALARARPGAGWVEDEEEGGLLPPGEWWVVDPVEGAINHIHGMGDWGVTATLVRDNRAVLTAVHLPLARCTYTAVRGGGAHLDGAPLKVSAKTELRAGLVATAQGKPGEGEDIHRRIGASVAAMLAAALVVRVFVPATLQLVEVAAGRMDAFWQYGRVRVGLLAGALLVEEAGGVVSDTAGRPWTPDSADFLAAAPALHAAAVEALSGVDRG